MGSIRTVSLAAGLCGLLLGGCAPSCRLAGQSRVAELRLYFGRSIPGGGVVGEADWRGFADSVLTPAFPDGFTIYDAMGAWRDREGHAVREATRVVEVVGDVAPGSVARVTAAYRLMFRQESVGVVSGEVCAAF